MEFKKSITIDFSIDVVINWKCPHCGKEHHTEYSESPYTIIADDPADIQCEGVVNLLH